MVEIHLMSLEVASAVSTRRGPEGAEEVTGGGLSPPNPGKLLGAVPRVVADVCGALTRSGRDAHIIEQTFS